jgi:hypothetical protein
MVATHASTATLTPPVSMLPSTGGDAGLVHHSCPACCLAQAGCCC